MRRTLQDMKKSESGALAQAFVPGFCINDGSGMWGGLMGLARILLSVDLARSQCFSSISGMGGPLSGLLPQVSDKRGIPKQSPGEE